MNKTQDGQTENANPTDGVTVSRLPLSNLSPEEITLAASVFAIIVAESLSDRDASLLASFLSTMAGNIALFLQKRTQEQSPPIPGQ